MRVASRVPSTIVLTAALAAASLAGCGGEAASPDGPTSGGTSPVVVAGVVLDSVTRDPVVGATVLVNDARGTTDGAGAFSLRAPSTFVSLQVYHPAYADYRQARQVPGSGTLLVPLVPTAPFTWACRSTTDSVLANVTDLQGRKTIVRRDTSGVHVIRGADTTFRTAYDWRWIPIDSLTYQVRLRIDGGPYDSLRWHIYDAKGHILERRCAALEDDRSGTGRNE